MSTTVLSNTRHEHLTLTFKPHHQHHQHHARHARTGRVLLGTRNSLLLLCPLLPTHKPKHALCMPEEVWRRILEFVLRDLDGAPRTDTAQSRMEVLRVCKTFKAAAAPLVYAGPHLSTQAAIVAFRDTLTAADTRWDAIRRIPYSSPGRWVISLDISTLAFPNSRLAIDTALTQIFPLTPFLTEVAFNPNIILSKRALRSLRDSCGSQLRRITGLGMRDADPFRAAGNIGDDPVTQLLTCPNLGVLEVIGGGVEDVDEPQSPGVTTKHISRSVPHTLPHLRSLSLIATTPHSPVCGALLESSLPNLTKLVITSYHSEEIDEQVAAAQALGLPVPDGGPGLVGGFPGPQQVVPHTPEFPLSTITSQFLQKHGQELRQLTLLSAPDWPPIPFVPPKDLLITCPNLIHLTLSNEKHGGSLGVPQLTLDYPERPHPLVRVTLSRPNEALLGSLDGMLRTNVTKPSSATVGRAAFRSPIANTRQTSLLPHLTMVKFTAVKWLKLASRGAQNAGTSGGMRQWKGLLRRYGVHVLDMENAEA